MRRKTIYEYHRISFPKNDVTNGTVVLLTPLPTCLGRKNCTSCMKKDINFEVNILYNLKILKFKLHYSYLL